MRKLLMITCLATAMSLQSQTVYKVDINEPSRNNMDEVLEPDFTPWKFGKKTNEQMLDMGDGVVFTMCSEQLMSGGWAKGFVQKKEHNCRLTGDGVNLDPNSECGQFSLVIKGLQPGHHNIQTYHNSWQDSRFAHWPITVSLNGQVVHKAATITEQKTSAQETTVLMTEFDVANTDEEVTITFSTSEADAPAEVGSRTYFEKTPILNGFVIDMANTAMQAKLPVPSNKDWHVAADNGTFLMSWSPASGDVIKHHLYVGTDSATVADATEAVYSGTDTTYQAKDLYNLNTYYWRVDEETADGTVTKGQTWGFRPRHLAFPDAEGYGRFATGGRGGYVYHVTNLNHDHNPGSLLYGLVDLTGPRTIVFDVSGIIEMDFKSFFSTPWVTIAPQTAPGKGICLKHCNMGLGSETICRFLRARRGYGDTGNALGCGNDHTIIDHCTAAWGTDETFSSRGAKNITFQYNMIAEALGIADHKNYESGKNHGFAATIGGEIGTFSHNLLVDCAGRNWSMGGGLDGNGKVAGSLDMFNNVCYNWNYRTTDGGAWRMQFVNNYYKMGADTRVMQLFSADNEGGGERTQFAYVNGNIRENKDGSLTHDQLNVTYRATGPEPEKAFVNEPFFPSEATIHSAKDAYKIVCSDAGATMPCRDDHHLRMLHETLNQTWTYKGSRSGIKGEIDHEDDQGGWEAFPEETRPADWDTDRDGMPNWWEEMTGSDPNVADNNSDPDHDGYTLLEEYIEFMSHPYVILNPAKQTQVDMKQFFRGFEKEPLFSISTNSPLVNVQVSDADANIIAKNNTGLAIATMQVKDAEGTTFSRRLSVAITANEAVTAIRQPTANDRLPILKREFFTLEGRKVSTMQSHETYIMRTTDSEGHQHNVKIIKN